MLSNQILHRTAQDIREITGLECSVWDVRGACLVRTSEKAIEMEQDVRAFGASGQESRIDGGEGFFLICDEEEPVYVLALRGSEEEMSLAGRMGASQLGNLILAYKERMDKNRFVQNLLLDNLLMVDVYNQARKMRIPTELVPRCPRCGRPMTMNLRCDDTFVQDAGWYAAARRYEDFLRRHRGMRVLFLELGVGGNTPVIIKYPFWKMTLENRKAVYACVNQEVSGVPEEIRKRSICITADIGRTLDRLRGRRTGGPDLPAASALSEPGD